MKLLLSLFLLCSFQQVWAQKAEVLLLDEDIDGKELERNFNVRRGSTHVSSLPDRDIREEALAGIPEIKNWDELKKDIFYMDLKSKTISQLRKKYPELKIKDLKFLKKQR